MESLTYERLVPRLVQAVPELPLNADDVAGNRAYLVFNDLMRFVISTLDAEQNTEVLTKIFSFIEGAAQTKDTQVEDVLQDALYQIAVAPIERTENAKMYMGSNTQKLFLQVEAQIYRR